MPGINPFVHSYLEHRTLAALRAMEPQQRLEMLDVIEAMAKAFPLKRLASLTLVVNNDRSLQKAESLNKRAARSKS
jgi:hypothetical protein